ncbi:MAG: branched-chain amino acid ABC transporter permease [Thermodesulfobacteriota bacterium]|jgi:branched-chain amino acid transport system permease protein
MKHRLKSASILFVLLLVVVFPLVMNKFQTYLVTQAIIYSVLGISYYLLLGHTGLVSFGHAAFFGVGAYAAALSLLHLADHAAPIPLAILNGAIGGLFCGLLFGLIVLRLTKIYLAFATLALSQMLWAIAWKWRDLTGGDDGLTGWSARIVSIPSIGQFALSNVTFFYYFVFLFAAISIALSWYFTKTSLGNTLTAIKSNSNRTGFLGVNVGVAKLMVFTFSGLIAGLSGALFILMKKMVSPHFLDMSMSFDILIISVIGGYASFVGPMIGALVYVYLVEYLSSFTERWQLLMGAFFVLLLLFYPKGVAGMIRDLIKKVPFADEKEAL